MLKFIKKWTQKRLPNFCCDCRWMRRERDAACSVAGPQCAHPKMQSAPDPVDRTTHSWDCDFIRRSNIYGNTLPSHCRSWEEGSNG